MQPGHFIMCAAVETATKRVLKGGIVGHFAAAENHFPTLLMFEPREIFPGGRLHPSGFIFIDAKVEVQLRPGQQKNIIPATKAKISFLAFVRRRCNLYGSLAHHA